MRQNIVSFKKIWTNICTEEKCLQDAGVTIRSGNTARVFISAKPLYLREKDGAIRPRQFREAYQTLSIMHEIGGHAYYFSKMIEGQENWEKTTWFENLIRGIFRGKHGICETLEIRNGKASEGH
ncbi:MAG: hypothetical protein J6X51_02620 [Bacteroidales bacterium]|nr:hypothetical protein [Bacteroidales bacterium]